MAPAESAAAPLVERLQEHVHRSQVRRVGAEDQRLTGDAHRVLDFRGLVSEGFNSSHDPLGPLDRSRIGQLDVQQQVALVLLRDEADLRVGELPVGEDEQAAVARQHDQAYPQQFADHPPVPPRHAVEKAIEGSKQ